MTICFFIFCWGLWGQTSWTLFAKPQNNNPPLLAYAAHNQSNQIALSVTISATATLTPTVMTSSSSWLRLPPLPADATQADIGEQIYIFVCQDCHGDAGQGLTDDWRAKWAPEDQNCWQSKCHDLAHPVEGFVMPRYVPAVMGDMALARFETAADLHSFIAEKMPWHTPGSLSDEEYWQLTLFLLRENGLYSDEVPFDRHEASAFRLRPPSGETAALEATATSLPASIAKPSANGRLWWQIIAITIIIFMLAIISGVVYWMRSNKSPQ